MTLDPASVPDPYSPNHQHQGWGSGVLPTAEVGTILAFGIGVSGQILWGGNESPLLVLFPLKHAKLQRQPEHLLLLVPATPPSPPTANRAEPAYPSRLISDNFQHNCVRGHRSTFTTSELSALFQLLAFAHAVPPIRSNSPWLSLHQDGSRAALWDLSSLPEAHAPLLPPAAPSVCPTVNIHGCRALRRGGSISFRGVGRPLDCPKAAESQQGQKEEAVKRGTLTECGQRREGTCGTLKQS